VTGVVVHIATDDSLLLRGGSNILVTAVTVQGDQISIGKLSQQCIRLPKR